MQSQCPKGKKEAVCGSPAGRRCHLPAGSEQSLMGKRAAASLRAPVPAERGTRPKGRAEQNARRVPKREPNSRTYEPRRNFGNLFSNQHSKAREAHVCQLREAELHPAVRALPAPR